jgi:hypothetical protein
VVGPPRVRELAGAFEEFQRTAFRELLASLSDQELATVLKATTLLQRASFPLPPSLKANVPG